jgi:hypothetical protein
MRCYRIVRRGIYTTGMVKRDLSSIWLVEAEVVEEE